MSVDRCVCHDVTFASLRALARELDPPAGAPGTEPSAAELAFEELQRITRCATGCGMCEPYIRLMLETGRTRFGVMEGGQSEKRRAQSAK